MIRVALKSRLCIPARPVQPSPRCVSKRGVEIADANPELQNLAPDVEALLVNRVGATREYFIAPIDECYRLVGLIRMHWRGLSGGAAVWGEIGRFFDDLRRKGA